MPFFTKLFSLTKKNFYKWDACSLPAHNNHSFNTTIAGKKTLPNAQSSSLLIRYEMNEKKKLPNVIFISIVFFTALEIAQFHGLSVNAFLIRLSKQK